MSVELADDVAAAVDSYCAGVEKSVRVAAMITKLRGQLDAANKELRRRHAQDCTWQKAAEKAEEEAGALQRELLRVKKEAIDTLALLKAAEAKLNERTH